MTAKEAVERLATKKVKEGECPPESMRIVPLQFSCNVTDDCRKCWIDALSEFLELGEAGERE
jgi:hypothetical protein